MKDRNLRHIKRNHVDSDFNDNNLLFHSSPLPVPSASRSGCFSAKSKLYKFSRRLLKPEEMDFDDAVRQTVNLFIAPKKVYRTFEYRRRKMQQLARDDPAFLVLLFAWISVSSIAFTFVLNLKFMGFIKFLLYALFVDCIAISATLSTISWFILKHYFWKPKCLSNNLEWGYVFDFHLNAYFAFLVIHNIFQLMFYSVFNIENLLLSRVFGNILWVISIGHYVYLLLLGFSSLETFQNIRVIFYRILLALVFMYFLSLPAGFNATSAMMNFYTKRVL